MDPTGSSMESTRPEPRKRDLDDPECALTRDGKRSKLDVVERENATKALAANLDSEGDGDDCTPGTPTEPLPGPPPPESLECTPTEPLPGAPPEPLPCPPTEPLPRTPTRADTLSNTFDPVPEPVRDAAGDLALRLEELLHLNHQRELATQRFHELMTDQSNAHMAMARLIDDIEDIVGRIRAVAEDIVSSAAYPSEFVARVEGHGEHHYEGREGHEEHELETQTEASAEASAVSAEAETVENS